jgi:hypothetical protein
MKSMNARYGAVKATVFLPMDESAHPNQPSGETPTPEVAHLLKMLELEAAMRRERRGSSASMLQTSSFKYGSLIAIAIFAFGSLGLLEWFLSQMPKPVRTTGTAAPGISANAGAMTGGTGNPAGSAEVKLPYRN